MKFEKVKRFRELFSEQNDKKLMDYFQYKEEDVYIK